jgi:predicted component of type VI protein secretion system
MASHRLETPVDERVPFLVATSQPLEGGHYEVTPEGLMIGRDEASCDVVVAGDDVSRRHARVLWHDGAVWIQDQGSRNGVFLNAHRVLRQEALSAGDEIAIGGQRFRLEISPRAARVAHPTAPMGRDGDSVVTRVRSAGDPRPSRALTIFAVILVLAGALWSLRAMFGD